MTDQELLRDGSHEGGHHVMATHWGMSSYPRLTPDGFFPPGAPLGTRPYAGVCDHSPASGLRAASIGWSGIIAEHLLGFRREWSPCVPLTAPHLHDWWSMFLQTGFEHLSYGDKAGILADKCSFRSFKIAWNVLRRNRARLRRLAQAQVEALRPTEAPAPSFSRRAELLAAALPSLPAGDRARAEIVLAHLRRGEDPPPSLFEPQAPPNDFPPPNGSGEQ